MNQAPTASAASISQAARMDRYYRFHAKIYDATRWSFLFGREALIRQVAAQAMPQRILEIGCGTGQNLVSLGRHFPQAELTGLDASRAMLDRAQKTIHQAGATLAERTHFVYTVYDRPLQPAQPFDLILFSYSLTMMNPGWQEALHSAGDDLGEGGLMAAVDFHDSTWSLFKRWMGTNHVRMDGHLLPHLTQQFGPRAATVRPAYGGWWHYFIFVGEKTAAEKRRNG